MEGDDAPRTVVTHRPRASDLGRHRRCLKDSRPVGGDQLAVVNEFLDLLVSDRDHRDLVGAEQALVNGIGEAQVVDNLPE